jgi:hypothetical protein
LDAIEARWPRRPRSFELEASRRAFVDACEAQSLGEPADLLLRGRGEAWVVHASARALPAIGPGMRCVRVIACETRSRALGAIADAGAPLAAVGVACGSPAECAALGEELEALGATLVCAPGRMQAPPLTWRQDGRRRLGDMLAWREVET